MAADMYLKITGIEKGESQDKTYGGDKGWFAIEGFSIGASNPVSITHGTGAGVSKVNLSDISVTKLLDTASMPLFGKCCDGTHFPAAEIVACKAGGSGGKDKVVYFHVKLTKVYVSSYNVGFHGDSVPHETVHLAYVKTEKEYKSQDEKGVGKIAGKMSWDVQKNIA